MPQCPAVCKLKDSDEAKDEACDEDNLLVVGDGGVATILSPRYGCGLEYRKKEICVYNVSLSCASNHVTISKDLSKLDLAAGDFLDIIDYSQKDTYGKITGSELGERDLWIHSSDFVVLFSSSNNEKTSGNGFSIHMECSEGTIEDPQEGSAAYELY